MASPNKNALRAALEFLADNEITLDYTFPAPEPTNYDDEPDAPELYAFIEKRPRMEDLFLLCNRLDNGVYDYDCGAFIFDFVVYKEDVDDLYDAISEDDGLIEEFFKSLCFTEEGKPRSFVHVMNDYIEFRSLPNCIRAHKNNNVAFIDDYTPDALSRVVCVNNDGVHLFVPEKETV